MCYYGPGQKPDNLFVGKGNEKEIITIAHWLSNDGAFMVGNISVTNEDIEYTSDDFKFSVSAIGPEIGTVPSNFTEVVHDDMDDDMNDDVREKPKLAFISPTKTETVTSNPSTGCLRCGGKGCIKCVKDYGRPWYDKIFSPGNNWTSRH